jgi:peptidyl-prolyl cis-trans isomerase C
MFAGALLFLLYYTVRPNNPERDVIILDDDTIRRMESLFVQEWGRKPTNEELKGLMKRQVQQEVFYRQALKMNLDHNDELIKRRMEQKLRFITHDLADLQKLPEDSLKAWYHRHKEKYFTQGEISFTNIFFSPDRRNDPMKDAEHYLAVLSKTQPSLPGHFSGDPNAYGQEINRISFEGIEKQWGSIFADSLRHLSLKQWNGPLVSGLGVHLVYIHHKSLPEEQPWAAVRNDVLRDYQYELSNVWNDKVFRDFRKNFKIVWQISDSAYLPLLPAGNDISEDF